MFRRLLLNRVPAGYERPNPLLQRNRQPAQIHIRAISPTCTYLGSVERAERNVSIDNIARIANALGVELWMFKDG
jgi:transcriptional regulator with XRE-family HTH domain